jgi:ABC-type transport system involved in multi-copper enzyme maturation permease subunit
VKRNRALVVDTPVSILPVIIRELKSQARQPMTYWLRVLGGIGVFTAFTLALWMLQGYRDSYGGSSMRHSVNAFGTVLFGKLNLCIFLAIWTLVPLSTADAISRERREGTLALLYLTELRSWGIVLGKASVHILRALSLFLTMGPWLMLPVLFGGVGLRDVGMAVMLNFVALLLALAAGLLASTIPRDWLRSVILAEVFALLLLLGMLHAHELVLRRAIRIGSPAPTTQTGPLAGFPNSMTMMAQQLFGYSDGILRRNVRLVELTSNSSITMSQQWFGGPFASGGIDTYWQEIWSGLKPPGHQAWFYGAAGMIGQAMAVLLIALWIASWCVQRSWQDAPPSAFVQKWRRTLFSPRYRIGTLRRNLSRSLTANPIGWLQHYSASARLVKWGWCLFILFAEIIFSTGATDLYDAQTGLGLILLLGLGFSATGSFRNELETGAFELLLVTPLRERQIILGRLRGLWTQFLPAILVYGAGSVYLASGWADAKIAQEAWLALARIMAAFCALPMVGLYFSVTRLNFFGAWIAACAVGLLPPALARVFGFGPPALLLLQLSLGLVAALFLELRLRKRKFLARTG